MKMLISDFKNHEFWIMNIGFEAYCWLLCLRKISVTLFIYLICQGSLYLVFWTLMSITDLGYLEDTKYKILSSNIFVVIMLYILTCLFVLTLKNLRLEIQSIYFFNYSARNENYGLNYLKMRTVLVKGLSHVQRENFEAKVSALFDKYQIYGCMYGFKMLPDYRDIFIIEQKKLYFELCNYMYTQRKVNYLSHVVMQPRYELRHKFS